PHAGFTPRQKLGLGQPTDRLNPAAQVVPIFRYALGTGQLRGHADDRNIGILNADLVKGQVQCLLNSWNAPWGRTGLTVGAPVRDSESGAFDQPITPWAGLPF